MKITRRHFLAFTGSAGLVGLGFGAGHASLASLEYAHPGFGPLRTDPKGVLDLPEGFEYVAFSMVGEEMSDGLLVPGKHDGMAAFAGPNGKTILIRNHELTFTHGPFGEGNARLKPEHLERMYDTGGEASRCTGGTTTLVFDTRTARLERHFLSLAGTLRNCAGGPTPWGSWISCEEIVASAGQGGLKREHGYAFEVRASATPGLQTPPPLVAMGRFNREAIAIDPASGIVYQTEDRPDGLITRFLPKVRGRLAAGGRLQALVLRDRPGADTGNHGWGEAIAEGQELAVAWVDLEQPEAPRDELRHQGREQGAARFARGEGMWYGEGAVYFTCTTGGRARLGQVWRYTPDRESPDDDRRGRLQLLFEPNDPSVFEHVDNLTVSPWGDLILCEDGIGKQFLVGTTPDGGVYRLGRNALNGSEFAGACFSPDGATLFVNIQNPGITLAVRGPWGRRRTP